MKKPYLVLCLIMALLAAVFTYWNINRRFPSPAIQAAGPGEALNMNDCICMLEAWSWYDGTKVEEILPGYKTVQTAEGNAYPADRQKLAIARISLKNTGTQTAHFDLTSIAFEMGAWHNQWDEALFFALNPAESLLYIDLAPGETKIYELPILFFDFQLTAGKWADLKNQTVAIVLDYYPVKYVLYYEPFQPSA